ncbi:kinase D-interacting substance 220, isoform CRA_a, partial [Rattus norvegicus]
MSVLISQSVINYVEEENIPALKALLEKCKDVDERNEKQQTKLHKNRNQGKQTKSQYNNNKTPEESKVESSQNTTGLILCCQLLLGTGLPWSMVCRLSDTVSVS